MFSADKYSACNVIALVVRASSLRDSEASSRMMGRREGKEQRC